MATPAIGVLEQALLGKRIVSPVVSVDVGGQTVKLVFVELSQGDKDTLRFQAISEVEADRASSEEASGGVEWRDAQVNLEEMRMNRWNLLMLQAAMRDPDDNDREVCSLQIIEKRMGSRLQEYLSAKYAEFEQGLDLDNISQSDVDSFIEDVKKNEVSSLELWGQYGTSILWGSISTLVNRLAKYETEKSSDT